MSDTRFPRRAALEDYDDPVDAPLRATDTARSSDPLAELARLIDEDPFADFNQRRRDPPVTAEVEQREKETFVAPPVEIEPDYAHEVDPLDTHRQPVEPELPLLDEISEATDYDRESTERLYADIAASQRVEPSLGRPAADPAPRQAAGEWDDLGFDAAAALEESLLEESVDPDPGPFDRGYVDDGERRAAAFEEGGYEETDPVFDESGHVPPYAAEPQGYGRRGKGMLILASLLGLVVVGGASALVYRGLSGEESDGPPPVIRADKAPSKVEPDATGSEEAPQQGKLVYDRVGNESSDETRLVSREEPVADIGNRQVRVIDPNQEQAALRGAATEAGETTGAAEELPKRVRTVVVKPDGTIVGEIEAPKPAEPLQPAPLQPAPLPSEQVAVLPSSEPAPAVSPATEPDTATDLQPQPAEQNGGVPLPMPRPAELASIQPPAPAETSAPPTSAPPAAAPAPVAPAPAPAASQSQPGANFVPPAAPATSAPATSTTPRSGQPLSLNPDVAASLPVQQPASAPTQTASVPATSQPAPAAAQAATFPAGSYVVQVAASRNEQDARSTAASITQRYGSVLSGYAPAIERADLGDRGIYYRVGVGPMKSQGDANSLCGKLKSAGLDCFVRRN